MKAMSLTFQTSPTSVVTHDFSTLPKPFAQRFYEYIKEHKDGRKKSEGTLERECESFFTHIAPFFAERGLKAFSEIDAEETRLFIVYLNTVRSKIYHKPLSNSTKRTIFSQTKRLFRWLASNHNDEAPILRLFSPNPFRERNSDGLKTKALDDTTMTQIRSALRIEKNVYVRAFIAVATYLGLRLEDIMELRAGCIISDPDKPGAYLIHYYNHKGGRWYKKPIPRNCSSVVSALKMLKEHTTELREGSGDERLFNWRVKHHLHGEIGSIRRYSRTTVKNWITSFIKRHDIVDSSGTIPHVSSHMFRHTLLSSMDEAGVDVEHAQHMADHAHSSTTRRYYVHSRDATYNDQMDVLDILVENITTTQNVATIEDDSFQNNRDALRLSDGYCMDTKMATDDEYVCEHYKKRGNCYGCTKMVTTPEFLPTLYTELEELEKELEEKSRHYGENVLRQIHFRIEMIKTLITRLEAFRREIS